MTTINRLFISLVAAALGASAYGQEQFSQPLTNDVPIDSQGMRLILSDESPAVLTTISTDRELRADGDVFWMLHNTSSNNWHSVVFVGLSNSFAFDLKTTDRVTVAKSSKGEAMNAGPRSLTDLRAHRAVRLGTGVQDFPKVADLFKIPSNGVYLLEVRYWSWSSKTNRFVLSEPVRVRVVKDEKPENRPNR